MDIGVSGTFLIVDAPVVKSLTSVAIIGSNTDVIAESAKAAMQESKVFEPAAPTITAIFYRKRVLGEASEERRIHRGDGRSE